MGWSFHAPKQNDIKQWIKVKWLYAEGFRFFGASRSKQNPLPNRLKDVKNFLTENPKHNLKVADRNFELINEIKKEYKGE